MQHELKPLDPMCNKTNATKLFSHSGYQASNEMLDKPISENDRLSSKHQCHYEFSHGSYACTFSVRIWAVNGSPTCDFQLKSGFIFASDN